MHTKTIENAHLFHRKHTFQNAVQSGHLKTEPHRLSIESENGGFRSRWRHSLCIDYAYANEGCGVFWWTGKTLQRGESWTQNVRGNLVKCLEFLLLSLDFTGKRGHPFYHEGKNDFLQAKISGVVRGTINRKYLLTFHLPRFWKSVGGLTIFWLMSLWKLWFFG